MLTHLAADDGSQLTGQKQCSHRHKPMVSASNLTETLMPQILWQCVQCAAQQILPA